MSYRSKFSIFKLILFFSISPLRFSRILEILSLRKIFLYPLLFTVFLQLPKNLFFTYTHAHTHTNIPQVRFRGFPGLTVLLVALSMLHLTLFFPLNSREAQQEQRQKQNSSSVITACRAPTLPSSSLQRNGSLTVNCRFPQSHLDSSQASSQVENV